MADESTKQMIVSALAAALYILVVKWHHRPRVTPDGYWYQRMPIAPSPFRRRWLAPTLSGHLSWEWISVLSVLVAAPLMSQFAGGPLATLLYLGLPGLVLFNLQCPVLVDAPAFALALGAAVASQSGHPVLAVLLSLLAGACKESAPLFAAAWTLNPWLLLGVLGARWWGPKGSGARELVADMRRRHDFNRWDAYLLPWGALVVLLPAAGLTWPAALSLALGYAQLAIATDTSRLYQWAAPAVIAAAVSGMPSWGLALIALHLWHPWRHVSTG